MFVSFCPNEVLEFTGGGRDDGDRRNISQSMNSASIHRSALVVRLSTLGIVGAVHGLAIWALASSTTFHPSTAELRSLPAVLILTNNLARVSAESQPLKRDVLVLEDPTERVMSLPAAPVVRFADANAAAVIVAPQLLDADPPDMAPFARQAGLLPGESAVVVLRVEVLPDGHVGQVEVDVSSGSRQVDEAAVAYVQTLAWVPGRLHGMETSTWVRQGVRLAA